MKEILTEKVKAEYSYDTEYEVITKLELPESHFYVGQNNVCKDAREFAKATIEKVYITYTKGFKEPYVHFKYNIDFGAEGDGTFITRRSGFGRVSEDKLKKKWFGYFDIDEEYIIKNLIDKLAECRQVAINEYGHIAEKKYAKEITEKIGKRMHRNFSEQINIIDFKDAHYNAPLDMIDVVEMAPIDIEMYLKASDASKEIKDAYREYAKMEFEKYLASSAYDRALDDYHPRISLHSIELYEYKVKWIAEHTEVFKDSKKFIDDVDTKLYKTCEYDNFTIKKTKKK